MSLADLFWTIVEIGFVAGLIGLTVIGNRLSLESRAAAAMQRRDTGTASALLQAQAFTDHAYGLAQWLPEVIIVCTPTRRGLLGGDLEESTAEPTTAAPPMAAKAHVPSRRVYIVSASRTVPATRPRRAGSRRTRRYRAVRAR